MDTIDIVKDWLDTLDTGTKIQSPTFKGSTWVKRPDGTWTRSLRPVGAWTLLSFSFRWKVVP